MKVLATQRGHAQVVADKDLIKQIRTYSDKDKEVAEALEKVQKLGPRLLSKRLDKWNIKNCLILFWGKVYIPNDPELYKELVRRYHDLPAVEHTGHFKTLELMSHNY